MNILLINHYGCTALGRSIRNFEAAKYLCIEDKDKSDLMNILTRTKISKNRELYEKYFKVLG
tara:strand:- start:379 stop:564 length:186 start_codon:yes stop_codon:yes gene_type:complete